MATLEENKDILKKLIKLIDELLNSDDWNKGIYLQTISGKIKELRQEANALVEEIAGSENVGAVGAASKSTGFINIFVSLYQADAKNLMMWARTLKRINEFSTSRPVYRNEDSIKQLIRARPDPTKEGYAIVHVKETDLIKPYSGKQLADRFGNELLTIREGAIKSENISKFVHGVNVYKYENGELTLESSTTHPI